MTELEICRGMEDQELIDTVRRHPMASLMPALTALLERVEVIPETNPEPEPEPEPEPPTTSTTPTKRCEYCMGSGIIALTRGKCSHCTDGRVPARKDEKPL